MNSIATLQCGCAGSSRGLERLRYFPRQLLTAADMVDEQDYFREKQRRHNRFLHGWGVVAGLLVQADAQAGPLALLVCPGYALGPCGDEIHVPEPYRFDLAPTLQQLADPCSPQPASAVTSKGTTLSVAIRYAECRTRPVRTLPAGCGCDDTACEFSRIRDGFEVRCMPRPDTPAPAPAPAPAPTLCEIQDDIARLLPGLPALPANDWIELAVIVLPSAEAGTAPTLSTALIDNNVRRVLHSTSLIQEQVITTCNAIA